VTESHHRRKFADELVSQDNEVSRFDFGGFRMNLEQTLESIEHRAAAVRRASLIACAAFVVFSAATGLLAQPPWVQLVCAVCSYASLITAGVLLGLYWHKYRPAVGRARSDLQLSMIADLQRQVAALSKRLDDQNESPST
jgi:hypothetical protein